MHTPDHIINRTCSALNLSVDDVTSKSRIKSLVEARCISVGLIIEEHPRIKLNIIADKLGMRDHSSVIYLRDKYNDAMRFDKQIQSKRDKVKYLLI